MLALENIVEASKYPNGSNSVKCITCCKRSLHVATVASDARRVAAGIFCAVVTVTTKDFASSQKTLWQALLTLRIRSVSKSITDETLSFRRCRCDS